MPSYPQLQPPSVFVLDPSRWQADPPTNCQPQLTFLTPPDSALEAGRRRLRIVGDDEE
jgi:hypothetical protein